VTATFDNTGPAGDTGFGPFIDLVFPRRGADGDPGATTPVQPVDGISFGTATYMGVPVTTYTLTFPDPDGTGPLIVGTVIHPLAVNNLGVPLTVTGNAGDTLVVAALPFGSFVTDQPPAPVVFTANVSDMADVGAPLTFRARAGFQYGADALNNPTLPDPTILSQASANSTTWAPSQAVIPQVVTVDKTAEGGLTGDNFHRQYTITINIAPGETVDGITVTDTLPSDMVYLGATAALGTITLQPTVSAIVDNVPPTNNTLSVTYASLTGGPHVITVDFYVPEADYAGNPVIFRAPADDATSDPNSVRVQGTWTTPTDPRDGSLPIDTTVGGITRTDMSMILNKGVSVVGGGAVIPGAILEHTLTIGVSDYFAFEDFVIDDTINDGHRWLTGGIYTPKLILVEHRGDLASAAMTAANYTVTPHYSAFGDTDTGDGNPADATDGTTDFQFRVSEELKTRRASTDGKMLGGCVPAGGTGGPPANCGCTFAGGCGAPSPLRPASVTIIYYTEIQEYFSDTFNTPPLYPGNSAVDQGDILNNAATATGNVLNVSNLTPNGFTEQDAAAAQVQIAVGLLSKELYAINGVAPLPGATIEPGDEVTYRITYALPTHNFEDLFLTDYLPLPVFDATEVVTFVDGVASAAAPAAGFAKFGPSDTLRAYLVAQTLTLPDTPGPDLYPVLTTSASQNTVVFTYGDFYTAPPLQPPDGPLTIDVLFTVTVTTDPYATGLLLTNQAAASESSTAGTTTATSAIKQIVLDEPVLTISKSVTGSTNPASVIAGGNITNSDAGDVITFTITSENTGDAPAYDVTFRDPAVAGFVVGSFAISSVTVDPDGAGPGLPAAATYTGNLFTGVPTDLILDDPVPEDAIISIVYTCTLADTVTPRSVLTNTAYMDWAAWPGRPKFGEIFDTATVTIAPPAILTKSVTAIVPGPATPNVVPGDVITYRLDVTIPEGDSPGVTITDILPAGFQYVAGTVAVASQGSGFSPALPNPPGVGGTAQVPVFSFGNVTVTSTNGTANNSFVLTYNVRVMDATSGSGIPLANKTNTAALTFTGNPGGAITSTRTLQFGEPRLTITKAITNPAPPFRSGDLLTFSLTVQNTGTAPAFDVVVTDVLNEGAASNALLDLSTVSALSTPAGYTYNYANPTVTYTQNDGTSLAAGGSVTFTFTANVSNSAVSSSTYTNTAAVTGDSQENAVPEDRDTSNTGAMTAVTIAGPAIAKSTVVSADTSQAHTANANVAIGETFTYRLTFTLPKALTRNVILSDIMNNANSWAGVTLVAATLARSNVSLSSVNNPNSINTAGAGVPVDVLPQIQTCPIASLPNCPAARMFSLPLGNVDNSGGSAGGDTYTLAITQRVDNVATNIDTRALQDLARLYYNYYPPSGVDTQANISSAVRTVTVRLPIVTIGKSVLPAAPAAGATVTYTLTITNTNANVNADGFDWTFQDVLPLQLKNAGSIVLLPGGTGATMNASFSGDNTVGWTLSGTIDRLDQLESVQVTYQAQIDPATPFSSTLSNLATAQTTTLPGVDANERNGSGGVNNLTASTNAPLTTSTPTLAKDVIGLQARYAIGDIVHYRLTMDIPVGTSTGMVITDQLPGDLAFLNAGAYVPVITLPAGITTSSNTVNEAGGLVTVTLGTVTATAAGPITIDYYAQVENVAANQEGVNLTNDAFATYNNPNIPPGGTLSTPHVSRTVTVGEPVLVMNKTPISGHVNPDAGTTVRWEFTVENTGTTTAWQTDIRDQVPNGINNIVLFSLATTGSPILDSGGNPVDSGDVAISTTVNADDTLTLTNIRIPAGSELTIQFDATVMNTVAPAQVLNNVVTADYASQQTGASGTDVVRDGADGIGGALNDYAQSASNGITIRSNIAIDKQADKTTATIGEEVIYTIRVSVIQGTTPSVSVNDTLPAGLTYVSHVISVGHMGMTFGNALYNTRLGADQDVGFGLGTVFNPANGDILDDYFDIAITARVDNNIAYQNNDILRNGESGTVFVNYGAGPSTVTYDYDPIAPGIQGRPLTLTEPELVVSKTAVPVVQALGSVVTYEITVMHDAGSTEDAWDLVLDDVLPVGMTYVPGSATLPALDVTVAGQNLQFRISSLTLLAHDITFYYSATVDNSAAVGVPLTNTIDLVWSGLSGATGAADNGRTGDDGPGNVLNNYATDGNASVTPATPAFIRAPKTVAIAVDSVLPLGQLDPLDILEYTIVLRNAGVSQATNVVYTDAIPVNTTYVAASLTTTQGSTDDSGNPLSVDVGTMDPADTVTITFRVTVNAGTPEGTIISNQGLVDSDQTVPRPTDDDDIDGNGLDPTEIIVGPRTSLLNPLYLEKRVAWVADNDSSGSVTPGDRLTYTLIVDNLGSTTLTGINITDTIPAGLTYVGGTLVVTQEVAPNAAIAGQNLTWPAGSLTAGSWAAAVFDVTINAPLPGSVNIYTFTNQGSADSNETTPIPSDGNGDPSDGYQPTSITAVDGIPGTADLDVQKRYTVAVDGGGDGYASPGDTLEYQIFITNSGSSPLHDVRIDDDPIPVNTTIVVGSVYTSQGAVLDEDPVIVNIGTVDPGNVITVRFRVLIDSNPPNAAVVDGLILSNQANVTSTEFPGGVLSDDNGVPGDGVNPDPTLTPIRVGASSVGAPTDLLKGLVEADTSEPGVSVPQVLIGEVLTYEVSVTMPEGLLRQATLKDTLPAGLTYVGNAGLARVFTTGITAATNPGNVNAAASTLFVPVTLTQSGQDLSLFLGDVINSDSDAGAEGYVLRYDVVVANIVFNQAGTPNTNSATLTYQDALGAGQTLLPASLPVTVTVAEPDIQMTLSADLAEIPAEGGTVTFTLVITNPGGANVGPGYDVNITDLLPAGYSNLVVANIIPAGGVAGGGNITDSSTAAGLDITVGTFPVNGALTIVFTVEAAPAETESDLTYTADVRWTSVPGTNGTDPDGPGPLTPLTPGASGTATGERNGSDGVAGVLNDYMATDSVLLTYKPARRAIRFENTFCTACNTSCTDPNEHYVSVPDSGILDLTVSGTIEAWIQATSCNPENSDAGIVMKGDNVSGAAYGFGLAGGSVFDTAAPSGSAQNIGFRVGNTVLVATGHALTAGKWYHVACTWDAGGMNIYINGILEATGPASVAAANAVPLTIGIQHVSATPGQYYGNVEEFRVWNTARAIGDIRNDMCRTLDLGALPGNLVSYLQYNEYGGSAVTDAAGGANGTLFDAFHVCSEAPLGDDSVHDYAASYTVTMTAGSDTFFAAYEPALGSWTPALKSGIQMYRVDDAPEPGNGPNGTKLFGSRGYWGVFVTGDVDTIANPLIEKPTYYVKYTYGLAGIGDENNLDLMYRHQGCAPWMDLNAVPDNIAPILSNTLSKTGLAGTEFILGKNVDPRNAIEFDGASGYVDVIDDASLDLTTDGTLEAWVYLPAAPAPLVLTAGIISKGNTTDGYRLTTDGVTGNQIVLTLYNGGVSNSVTSTTVLNRAAWYHIAATWDGVNMRMYVNGVLDNTNPVAQISGTPTGNLTIGSIGAGNYFLGRIDEVRVWKDVALDVATIDEWMCKKLIYNNPPAVTNGHPNWDGAGSNDLGGYWRFDEETISAICPDYSSNTNDGTMTAFVAAVIDARICSSAPIGDYSAYNYGAGASTVTLNPTGDPFRATANGGAWAAGSGIHVYRLDEAPVYGPDISDTPYTSPNGLTPPVTAVPPPANWSSVDYYRYFGAFVTDPNSVGGPIYDVVYNYNANPMAPTDDSVLGLARRDEFCDRTWGDPGASVTLNTVANTLTFGGDTQNGLPKQNPEYILGGKTAPLAITLASFTAMASDGCVDVDWETATEINAAGFHVWRSDNPLTGFVRVNNGLIASKSMIETMGAKYTFTDCGVDFSSGKKYYYMLEEVEIDSVGSDNMHGPIGPVSETVTAAQSARGGNDKNCFINSLNEW